MLIEFKPQERLRVVMPLVTTEHKINQFRT